MAIFLCPAPPAIRTSIHRKRRGESPGQRGTAGVYLPQNMRRKSVFIHERHGWPDFTWEAEALAAALASVRYRQGRLLGRMEALGFDLRAEAGLAVLTSEVVKSSAIEGEILDPGEVRSSLARRLGLETAGLPRPGRDV